MLQAMKTYKNISNNHGVRSYCANSEKEAFNRESCKKSLTIIESIASWPNVWESYNGQWYCIVLYCINENLLSLFALSLSPSLSGVNAVSFSMIIGSLEFLVIFLLLLFFRNGKFEMNRINFASAWLTIYLYIFFLFLSFWSTHYVCVSLT